MDSRTLEAVELSPSTVLNIELGKKLVRRYVWSIALYSSETWTLRKLKRNI
jgi:hypothetical protein